MIFSKTRASLHNVRDLNMWGHDLVDVSIISECVNATTLVFTMNRIKTLEPFASCRALRVLLLRENQIANLDEVEWLRGLPYLEKLSLVDNPVARQPGYRDSVIRLLPSLQVLDEVAVGDTPPAPAPTPRNVEEPVRRAAPQQYEVEEPPVRRVAVQQARDSDDSMMTMRRPPPPQPRDVDEAPPQVRRAPAGGVRLVRSEADGVALKRVASGSGIGAPAAGEKERAVLAAVLMLIPTLGLDSLKEVVAAVEQRLGEAGKGV